MNCAGAIFDPPAHFPFPVGCLAQLIAHKVGRIAGSAMRGSQVFGTARLVKLQKGEIFADAAALFRAGPDQDAIRVKKLDDEEQVVFGEVYAPGFPDSQGDVMSRSEVQKMAYNFMKKGLLSNIDTNHSRNPNGSRIVESFIARENDDTFLPGAWVIGVHVPDRSVWKMVKSGDLNGFSLDGMGLRTETIFEIEMPEVVKGETTETGGHTHTFFVKYDAEGNFRGGMTSPALDGHVHKIERGTVTEVTNGHSHRFSFVEGVLSAQSLH
jgi:hypothetical protein